MRPLTARRRRPPAPRDPAPSKWGYRMQRLMLTPGFVRAVRVGTPLAILAVIGAMLFGREDNRAMLAAHWESARDMVEARPEFRLTEMIVTGAGPALTTEVQRVLPVAFPTSSFDLDFDAMRATAKALDAVEEARVRVGENGQLVVDITPRVPVALWRDGEQLRLIDAGGVFSGEIASRADRADLPLIAGDGAQTHIAEALALFRAATPIKDRVRGLVRMGERRWDMVLDRNQRILLPEDTPARALDRVLALHAAQDLLARDVLTVDLRNGHRATIQLQPEAAAALRRELNTGIDD